MPYDYVIVGTGLTGATVARILTDRGKRVICFDRRGEVGGNCADHKVNGVWVHKYGPHLFRTQSTRVWNFLNRFTTFRPYQHSVVSYVDGEYRPWPPVWGEPEAVLSKHPTNFREACLSRMSLRTYYTYVKPYTEKQWGVSDTVIPAKLANRFAHHKGNSRLLHPKHRYQGIPTDGYSNMIRRMLDGVEVVLNTEIDCRDKFTPTTIYSGDVGVYLKPGRTRYSSILAPLRYRCQDRKTVVDGGLDYPQINVPNPSQREIRHVNWHAISGGQKCRVTTVETPRDSLKPDEYEYPMWDENNYRAFRSELPTNVIPCGRLGTYRYLDMDQAVAAAMSLTEKL